MGQPGLPPAPDPIPEACTVEEAKRTKVTKLNLRKSQRTEIPAGLKELGHLRIIDVSDNPIRSLLGADGQIPLPEQLAELVLTGCQIEELPADLAKLTALQKFFMGANRLTAPGPVFTLPSLLHAGLSYNHIQHVPDVSVLSACTSLISLDLSGCDLEDLDGTLSALTALPRLQSLSLAGNPFCLLPRYTPTVKGALGSKLVYLDGQRVEPQPGATASRPGTAQPTPALLTLALAAAGRAEADGGPAAAAAALSHLTLADLLGVGVEGGDEAAAAPVDTFLELKLEDLQPLEDPFQDIKDKWASDLASAQAAGTPPTFTQTPPLQPCFYWLELEGCDGTSLSRTITLTNKLSEQATQRMGGAAITARSPGAAGSVPNGSTDGSGVSPGTVPSTSLAAGGQSSPGEGPQAGPPSPVAIPPAPAAQPTNPPSPMLLSSQPVAAGDAAAGSTGAGGTGLLRGEGGDSRQTQPVPEVPELFGGEATQYASIPFKVMPPQPPSPDTEPMTLTGAKGKDKKGSKPSTPKPGSARKGAAAGGKKGATAMEPVAEAPLERGCLKVVVGLQATVASRDWLRNGIKVRLHRTQLIAVPKPPAPAPTPTPPATPSKGTKAAAKAPAKPKAKEEPPPGPDMSQFDIVPTTSLIGGGVVPGVALVSGSTFKVSELVPLLSERALWDDKGIRMALKDPRHSTAPVAHCNATLTLHVMPQGVAGRPGSQPAP